MKLLLLLLLVSCQDMVLTAPVGESMWEEAEQGCSTQVSENNTVQEELDQILEQGLLNNTENVAKIKQAFDVKPGTLKLCARLSYEINCTDQEECEGLGFNCSTGNPHLFVWTSFDTTTLTGRFLFDYAMLGIDVFGFEWADACNTSYMNLSISVPSLMLLCEVENSQSYITSSLHTLTEKVTKLNSHSR